MNKPDFVVGHRIIVGGTTNWAQLTTASGPSKFSEKYQVDLTLDATSAEEMKKLAIDQFINIKNQEGEFKYPDLTIRFKSKGLPQIFDRNKVAFDDLINNGSVMRIAGIIKSWEMAGKKGLTCYINQGVVLEAAERTDSLPPDFLFENVKVKSDSVATEGDDLPF